MSQNSAVAPAPPRRSPSFPGVNLESAIDRLKTLYAAERQHAAPIETAVKHWGYKGPNGKTNLIISALKKFGLIVDSGSGRSRKIQVTDAGRRILEHPHPDERRIAIQKAALLPPIHAEMWEKYGLGMPTDETWIWELKEDRDFTDVGARDFVREYRETIQFARLGAEEPELEPEPDEIEPEDEAEIEPEPLRVRDAGAHVLDHAVQQFVQHRAAGQNSNTPVQTYPIPIALHGKPPVLVSGAFPLTDAEWTQFTAVLAAMKPVLVDSSPVMPPDQGSGSQED